MFSLIPSLYVINGGYLIWGKFKFNLIKKAFHIDKRGKRYLFS